MSTTDLHFLGFLTLSKHEVRAVKETVHDVGLIFHPVVRHFPLSIVAHDK